MARQLAAVARDGSGQGDGFAVDLQDRGLAEGRDAALLPGLEVLDDPVLELHLKSDHSSFPNQVCTDYTANG